MNIFQRAIHAVINRARKGEDKVIRVHEGARGGRVPWRKRNSYRMARSGGPVLTGERLRKVVSSSSMCNLTVMPKHLSADEQAVWRFYRAVRLFGTPPCPANGTVKKGAA